MTHPWVGSVCDNPFSLLQIKEIPCSNEPIPDTLNCHNPISEVLMCSSHVYWGNFGKFLLFDELFRNNSIKELTLTV